MAVADTAFLIDVLRGDEAAVEVLEAQVLRNEPIWAPAPVIHELYYGAGLSSRPDRERRRVESLLAAVPGIPYSPEAARKAGNLEAEAERSGGKLGRFDVQVAAVAMTTGQALVTRDRRLAAIPGLETVLY